jgi:two-component system, OmpR family, response regulator
MSTASVSDESALGRSPLIFVVEDEDGVAQLLVRTLEGFAFRVRRFADARSVILHLRAETPDLCIVDLGLPDMDGIELVRHITQSCPSGVLILTGRDHTVDRVMGLELGGDDYVTKPFEPRELVARVRSILRRRQAAPPTRDPAARTAQFKGWTFDCAANTLRSPQGDELVLGVAEAQVLRVFLQRPHQILTREQLVGQRDLSPLDRSIDVRISRLRRRLEADPHNPKVIKTVYGAGYMLTATVEWS